MLFRKDMVLKVAIDNQIFLRQKFGGVSRYYCELAKALTLKEEMLIEICSGIYINDHLRMSDLVSGNLYIPGKLERLGFHKIFDKMSNRLANSQLNNFKPDIIHETFFSKKDLWNSKAVRVLTVFDLTRELIQNDSSKISRLGFALNRAHAVICISDSTKNDLLRVFDVDPDKVSVIHLGVNEIFKHSLFNKISRKQNRLLFVGQRQGYKNFENFIKAFAKSSYLTDSFKIEIFGGGKFSNNETCLLENLGLLNKVIKTDGDDLYLSEAYRTATALIYPSLHEGFGLPLVEAMASGCPIISSDNRALTEVAGNAAAYFDGTSIDAIKHSLEANLDSQENLKKLSELGFIRSKLFSWEKCADETALVYGSLMDKT